MVTVLARGVFAYLSFGCDIPVCLATRLAPSHTKPLPSLFVCLFFLSLSAIELSFSQIHLLRIFAQCLFGVSLLFWVWAIHNSYEMGPGQLDLGVVSFGSVLMSSSYLFGYTTNVLVNNTQAELNDYQFELNTIISYLITVSHGLVTFNYIAGTYVGYIVFDSTPYTLYCAIFSGLWLGVTVYGRSLMASVSEYESIPFGRRGRTGSTDSAEYEDGGAAPKSKEESLVV